MRYSMAMVALLLGLAVAPLASSLPGRVLPFRLEPDGDIVVPVTIDGEGPFEFLFDTGSSRTIVSNDTARRLGLRIVGQTRLVTPGGQAQRPLAPLARVAIGTGPPATVLAMLAPADALGGGRAIHGIIGQDILGRHTYTIDYERRRLTWHSTPAVEMPGTRLPLESSAGRLLVSLTQADDVAAPWAFASMIAAPAVTLKMIPDSGSDGFVLFARDGRALPRMITLDGAGLKTLSGERSVQRVVIDVIDVGEIRLRNQVAVVIADVEPDATLADGLLPLHLFARVTFNGPQKMLIVEAR